MKLIKASEPGWEKDVDTRYEACKILWPHICGSCRDGLFGYLEDGSQDYFGPPATEYDLDSMLSTPCGCEFWLEEDECQG